MICEWLSNGLPIDTRNLQYLVVTFFIFHPTISIFEMLLLMKFFDYPLFVSMGQIELRVTPDVVIVRKYILLLWRD